MRIEDIKVPGKLSRKEEELRISFFKQMEVIPGSTKIKSCIQCGTCTGSCPVSYAMDIPPRELIALFRAGDMETILNSKSIWVCASCYSCQARCPSQIKITDIIYALKRLAMEKKIYPPNFPVYSLAESFVKIMNRFGRLHEPRLLVYYLLKTSPGKLFSFVPLGLRMAKKKRIAYTASKIRDLEGLKKIIEKAEMMDAPEEMDKEQYMRETVGYGAVASETVLESKKTA
jgi:heterodisulfide reductase subunit C